MTEITRDVQFTVNVSDRVVTAAGFGTLGIFAPHVKRKERVLSFADIDEVDDVFPTTDPVYLAAQAAFSQKSEAGSLQTLKFLRQLVDRVALQLPTANVGDRGDVLTVSIDEVRVGSTYQMDTADSESPVTYTAATGDTAADIALALVTAQNLLAAPAATATDNADGTFLLTGATPDTPYQVAFLTYTPPTATPTTIETNAMSITGGYALSVNFVLYASTSGSTSTAATIMDALASYITTVGGGVGHSATGNGDGTASVTIVPATVDYLVVDEGADIDIIFPNDPLFTASLGRGTLEYHAPSASETIADSLSKAKDVDNDFYAVGSLIVDDAAVTALAAAIATESKIHGYITESTNVPDAAVTVDIMSTLKAAAYDRTFGTYRKTTGTFLEFAWMADRLPTNPGSSTWKFKTLVGQSTDDLTSAEEAAVLGKNGNVYTDLGGSGATAESKMASGRFIDIQRSIDFIEARINEAILARLKNEPKIPYTDAGFSIIDAILRERMTFFVRQGILGPLLDSTTGELFRITIPKVADQTTADRAARTVTGIIIEGQLAGAIHRVVGTVNVNV